MKNPSEIAKELRARGHKFSQTRLLKELESFECVFAHGRFKFYDDAVVGTLDGMYHQLYPIKPPAVKPVATDLEKITAMLEAICRELNIKTTTEIK